MTTNEFVNDLKSLSLTQSENDYIQTVERLLIRLKDATPNGLLEDKPFGLSLIDNLYRVIPIFDKKLSSPNAESHVTNAFLETLYNACRVTCITDLFLALKNSPHLEAIFQNYVSLLKEEYFSADEQYDYLASCLINIMVISSVFVSISEDQLPSNYISYSLAFTKKYWQVPEREQLVNQILITMKIFCKKPKLVPTIIYHEWPQACLQWLTFPGRRPSYNTDIHICYIVQKLARCTIGVNVLNQLNCIKALGDSKEQMKKDHSADEYSAIDFIQSITYALLVEADEIKENYLLADELMCHILEQLVSLVFDAIKSGSLAYRGFHITEALVVLSKLFVNDDILKKCLKDSSELFDCLSQLLIRFAISTSESTTSFQWMRDEILITLTNLFWSISFHQFSHAKFQSNSDLMAVLSNFANSSSLYITTREPSFPLDLCSLKKAAEGILWNLKFLHLPSSKDKSCQEQQESSIMISYSHSDSKFCHELVEHLSQHVPIWVDYKQIHSHAIHSDDLWEDIAGAMEKAIVIVLIVSKHYYESKSCRQELSYASDTLKKRLLPIYAPDQQYRANGWLGIRIAGQKYVHFGRKPFVDAANDLLSIVHTDKKLVLPVKPIQKTVEQQENAFQNWTSKDIQKWFDNNRIHRDLFTLVGEQFSTGTALLIYARHLKHFYRQEYTQISSNYSSKFDGKHLQTVDFITFVDALWRLYEEQKSSMINYESTRSREKEKSI
ncbi:unnamed protein product [Adineta ricciae]|uniref:TIR domain-containing protein n=1 Tax=Adineta ricciae TaxID=249248 RepID=A0A813SJC5_ADIRI|nr:unnamed protein product [Adineta ricciae]CAF1349553.1 unnamed protein product [Adineta ricciae]